MNIPDPDEIVFSGFKEDMAMPVFATWLESNEINFNEVMVFKRTKPGTFTISNMETEEGVLHKLTGLEAKVIVDKLHGSVMDGRRINVVMTCLTTPNKIKKREVINLDETPEGDASVEEVARISAKEAKTAASKKAEEAKKKKAEVEKKKADAEKKKNEKKKVEPEPTKATAAEGKGDAAVEASEKTPEGQKVPKMQLAAIFTKGGSKTHAVRVAGEKSAREDKKKKKNTHKFSNGYSHECLGNCS